MGKELAAARKIEEDQSLKRERENREREKAEFENAKAEMLRKLEEDRKERRRKLGLPEELTEEEKSAEAAKRVEETDKLKKRFGTEIIPAMAISQMRESLVTLKKTAHAEEQAQLAFKTLMAYTENIARQPDEEKFRRIKLTNNAFKTRVDCCEGGREFLTNLGFALRTIDGEDCLVLDKVSPKVLNAAGGLLTEALTSPFFGVL